MCSGSLLMTVSIDMSLKIKVSKCELTTYHYMGERLQRSKGTLLLPSGRQYIIYKCTQNLPTTRPHINGAELEGRVGEQYKGVCPIFKALYT